MGSSDRCRDATFTQDTGYLTDGYDVMQKIGPSGPLQTSREQMASPPMRALGKESVPDPLALLLSHFSDELRNGLPDSVKTFRR